MALTHFDADGHAHMVDVSGKDDTDRVATATAYIKMQAKTLDICLLYTSDAADD